MITTREMREIPKSEWPFLTAWETMPIRVWRSNDYLAVLYVQKADGNRRLTVNRTRRNGKDWRDGITWDELQRIKNECLGEDVWCIENYPAQSELLNVCNQRHLFVLDGPPAERFPEKAVMEDSDIKAAIEIAKALRGDRS